METAAFVLAVVAFLLALSARSKANGFQQAVEDAQSDGRRRVENLREEYEAEIAKLREMVALLAEGSPVSGEMIREGRTWEDVVPTAAQELFAAGDLRTIDVRTPQETKQGILPGAKLIPIDQLEERLREIPKDGKPTLIYCAGGGRSAAACEFLSTQGYSGLMNLQGGFSSWAGPVERPE